MHSALISSCDRSSVHCLPHLHDQFSLTVTSFCSLTPYLCLCRPTPKVEWKKKDGVLADTTGQVINFDRWLHFDSITLDDDGEYECKASNAHGSITRSFTVTVEGRPLSWAHRRSRCSADREDVTSVLVWTLTSLCSSVWDACEESLLNLTLNTFTASAWHVYMFTTLKKYSTN